MDAAEGGGTETGAIDDERGEFGGKSVSVANVCEDSALESYPVLEALREEPREVDRCVNADRGEGCGGVDT